MGAIIGRSTSKTIQDCKTNASVTHTYSSTLYSEVGGFIGIHLRTTFPIVLHLEMFQQSMMGIELVDLQAVCRLE
jgi:hypothetical protein